MLNFRCQTFSNLAFSGDFFYFFEFFPLGTEDNLNIQIEKRKEKKRKEKKRKKDTQTKNHRKTVVREGEGEGKRYYGRYTAP